MIDTSTWGPLSREQLRLWMHSQVHPGDSAYVIRSAKRFRVALDSEALHAAVDRLLHEYPVLTWTFRRRGALVERRADQPRATRHLTLVTAESDDDVERQLEEIELDTTDLSTGPLFRVVVASVGPADSVVCLLAHHVIVDAWSTEILWRDLAVLYNRDAYRSAEKLSYGAYAELGYSPVPARPRPAAAELDDLDVVRRDHQVDRDAQPAMRHLTFEVPAAVAGEVDVAAARCGVTPFTVLLAAFGAAVRRYDSRVERLALTTHVSTRLREDLTDSVGFFIRTVPIVLDFRAHAGLRALLGHVCEQLLATLDSTAPDFEGWTAAHGFSGLLHGNPTADICFQQLTHSAAAVHLQGVKGTDFSFSGSRTGFRLSVTCIRGHGQGDAPLTAQIAYDSNAYTEGTIETICTKFVQIVRDMAGTADVSLNGLGDGVYRRAAVVGNDTTLDNAPSVWDRLESLASSGRTAVSCEDGREFTTADLLALARRIASGVQRHTRPGDRVAVATEDRLTGLLVMLACWRIGCVVVHMSPAENEVDEQTLDELGIRLVLVDQPLTRFPPGRRPRLTVDAVSSVDELTEAVPPPDVAYLIATSGTTGRSVWVERSMAVLEAFLDSGRVQADWCVIQTPRLSFDPGIRDTLLTLTSGAELFLGDEVSRDPVAALARAIELGHGDAVIAVVPSILHAVLARLNARHFRTKLHTVRCVGEPVLRATAALCRAVLGTDLVVDYGTTEAAMVSLSSSVSASAARTHFMPLGSAVPPSKVMIIGQNGKPADRNVLGEIIIAGPHVATRYLGTGTRGSLSRDAEGRVVHRTGDLGYVDDAGVVHWVARADAAVKVRGRMVDLQMVQRALENYPGVDEACAYVAGEGTNARLMVAYSVTPGTRGLTEESVRAHLYQRLGARHSPSRVVEVDRLPRSTSGKVRMKELPQLTAAADHPDDPPRTATEAEVASCIAQVLGCPSPTRLADFFALGGHSLDAIHLASLLSAQLAVKVDARAIFENPTVSGLSQHIVGRGGDGGPGRAQQSYKWISSICLGARMTSATLKQPVQIMGVLNVTPDSFFDGGLHTSASAAIAHGRRLVVEGADVVDVGGESTRPGALPVSPAEEARRVLPVVEALAEECVVSIDTRHDEVARAAVKCGATIINDISASLWSTAADLGCGWIAMHMQGTPQTMQDDPRYDSVVDEVFSWLETVAATAARAGVSRIWVDPGFGFGKSVEHNVQLLANLDRLVVSQPFPVVAGMSRKSFLGALTGRGRAADRFAASIAAALRAASAGVQMLRVHDVAATRDALTVYQAAGDADLG